MEKLVVQIKPVAKISGTDRAEFFNLFEKYYSKVTFAQFVSDLMEKDFIIVFREAHSRRLAGFSTILCRRLPEIGRGTFVFSGDTVVAREHWGSKILQTAFGRFLIWIRLRRPFEPIYWMLISKGFKTYMMMVNNFGRAYPRLGVETPESIHQVMMRYYQTRYGSSYSAETDLIEFETSKGFVSRGMADPNVSDLKNPDVEYFVSKNPRYQDGVELACIAEIRVGELVSAYLKQIKNILLRRYSKQEAHIVTDLV